MADFLPLDFIGGATRASFPDLPTAIAAARAAVDQDEKHRARAVWHIAGTQSAGVTVPTHYVVGLASGTLAAGVKMHIEGELRRRREASRG